MMQRQRGTTTVEFAIIGTLLFALLFGIVEVARAMFVFNSIDEATRRGARVAAVCPMNNPDIARVAVFGTPGGSDTSPLLPGLTTANVSVEYLTDSGATATGYSDTAFVRVSITGYSYPLLFPFGTINVPSFATTIPAESLGLIPDLGIRSCYGS